MKSICTLLLVACFFTVSAQQKGQALVDSLLTEMPKLKDDSNKVLLLNRIVEQLYIINPKEGIGYAEKALELAKKINWKKGIALQHNNLGLMIQDTGNNVMARQHLEQSYVLNKELDSKTNQITNLNNIARSYQRESEFIKASEYLFKALAIAEEIKSSEHISLVAGNIFNSFSAQKNYTKAILYAEMALKHAEIAKIPRYVASSYMQLGVYKLQTKDSAAAKIYYAKSLKIYEEINNQQRIAQVLSNMAELEYPDYKKIIAIRLKAQAIFDVTGHAQIGSITNLFNLANNYYELAMKTQPPAKNEYLKRAAAYLQHDKELVEQAGNNEILIDIYYLLSQLETEKGNYKAALENYKTGKGLYDSLFSQEKKNEIAGLEEKHTMAIKDNEIAINKLMLANQQRTQLGLMTGLGLLAIIGGLLFWQSRSRKKTNTTLMGLNNQLDEANKVKARFFSILSHDLRSPIVNLVHFLHLQKDDPDMLSKEQQATHRKNISDAAEDLLNNMEAMLLWSKEQMENFRPNIKDIAIDDLFGYLEKFFGQVENITLSFHYPPGMVVSTDENYLRTIMQNLTSNAIRALKNTTNGTIAWEAKKEGDTTIISITDNGPGIDAAQAKALFDDSTVNNEKTGLGLHLIRDLAKAIHYKISVESEPGKGSTFLLSS